MSSPATGLIERAWTPRYTPTKTPQQQQPSGQSHGQPPPDYQHNVYIPGTPSALCTLRPCHRSELDVHNTFSTFGKKRKFISPSSYDPRDETGTEVINNDLYNEQWKKCKMVDRKCIGSKQGKYNKAKKQLEEQKFKLQPKQSLFIQPTALILQLHYISYQGCMHPIMQFDLRDTFCFYLYVCMSVSHRAWVRIRKLWTPAGVRRTGLVLKINIPLVNALLMNLK